MRSITKPTKTPPATPLKTRKSRRVLFVVLVAILFVAVVVYETSQELRRTQTAQDLAAPDRDEQALERAEASLRRYYRSHDLPTGWQVGEITRAAERRFDVSVHFLPGVNSSRHGQAAPPGEITAATACPADDAVWRETAGQEIRVLVNDKTGVIGSIVCPAPDGPSP